jgi:V-type H+-transporting ATPase proteolipid subunit
MNTNYHLHVLAIGAAYGTSKAGIGIAGIGSFKPELVMKVTS